MALQDTKCVAIPNVLDQNIARRSANYCHSIWEDSYIKSLKSDYRGELFGAKAVKLVEQVRIMLEQVSDPSEQVELVDTLQRFDLSYRFENETKRILERVWANQISSTTVAWKKDNLYATALEFRLLRQDGYKVTQEVFSSFMDEKGNFKASLSDDCKGLLSLYEASYLLVEGESMLENARQFASKHLKEYVKQKQNKNEVLSMLVEHALEVPLRWRSPRVEARWFIDVYDRRRDRNPILLELAKLDFNIVQAIHHDDLRYLQKWWKDLCFGEKLPFARDRLVECFFWAIGVAGDPPLGNCRRILAKLGSLITVIDDVYDVYGTMDELVLFTEAVERWDTNAMEQLPEYMKICFLALFNSVNEMGYEILKEQGFDAIPLLKKMWANLCKAYLLEARWYHSGYKPTLQEYIDNAMISISYPVTLLNCYLATTTSIRKECLECLKECTGIVRFTSVVGRLADDLGTSSDELKRGDVLKSIQCYMHETGASEEKGRQHIRELIDATWKKINEEQFVKCSPFSHTLTQIALNLSRMAQCVYQYGDGHGMGNLETKDRILSIIFFSIPYN